MKKLTITCALLTSISFAVSAQNTKANATSATTQASAINAGLENQVSAADKASEQTAEKNTKMLQTKLGLTNEQYAAVYKIECRYQKYVDQYPANTAPAGTLSNITSETIGKMRNVLTSAQFEKYQALQNK